MVLATNYELVSDATRALDSLRRIEELTPDHEIDLEARVEYGNLRKRLLEHTTLPAIPAWRVTGRSADSGRATQVEIEELYRQFLELGEDQKSPDSNAGGATKSEYDVRSQKRPRDGE